MHGLGAAIESAIALCDGIAVGSRGGLKLSARTSTVAVADDVYSGASRRQGVLVGNSMF